MTGQMRRQVPCLNGPAHTRFVADGVQGDSEAAEEAKQLLEIATVRYTDVRLDEGGSWRRVRSPLDRHCQVAAKTSRRSCCGC